MNSFRSRFCFPAIFICKNCMVFVLCKALLYHIPVVVFLVSVVICLKTNVLKFIFCVSILISSKKLLYFSIVNLPFSCSIWIISQYFLCSVCRACCLLSSDFSCLDVVSFIQLIAFDWLLIFCVPLFSHHLFEVGTYLL